jgi:hypothetical protein
VRPRRIVVLGMMTRIPVAGVVWQTAQYLVGLERLGFETWYVEEHGMNPSMFSQSPDDDGAARASAFLEDNLRRFGLERRWAYRAVHSDGRLYGLSEAELGRLYAEADLVINLLGSTVPRAEHAATGRLIYVESDPVVVQVELHQGDRRAIEYLEPHVAFFTYGENIGRPGCNVPASERFQFRPTRQPIVLDFWPEPEGWDHPFTTIASWRQWRDVVLDGETYSWSKHLEFLKVVDLPRRTGRSFELALSGIGEKVREKLERKGWTVRDAMSFTTDLDRYREYIGRSYAEFTVAKDQNVRLRSGWFSDRSAAYLASGRPVVTQETGFSDNLPTGEGLFAFSTLEEAAAAVETIAADYDRHRRAARSIAAEHFDHEKVLTSMLADVGL